MKYYLEFILYFGLPIIVSCTDNTDEIYRIINGTNAPEYLAPYMVSIRLKYNNHLCGGSIISQRTVLTAAHCLTDITVKDIFVVAGSTKLDSGGFSYEVTSFKLHENFSTETLQHDIGMVFVRQDFKYNNKIQPLALPKTDTVQGLKLILTGWGYTSYDPKTLGRSPNDLQLLLSTSISNEDCQSRVPTTIYETQLCALNKLGEGACYADSGSPLVTDDHQVGIVSWAYPCAKETPDVYTRVYAYLPWIYENIQYSNQELEINKAVEKTDTSC